MIPGEQQALYRGRDLRCQDSWELSRAGHLAEGMVQCLLALHAGAIVWHHRPHWSVQLMYSCRAQHGEAGLLHQLQNRGAAPSLRTCSRAAGIASWTWRSEASKLVTMRRLLLSCAPEAALHLHKAFVSGFM